MRWTLLVLSLALGGAGCTATSGQPRTPGPSLSSSSASASSSPAASQGWRRLEDAPLSHRENAMVERLGPRVVVIGGNERVDCPGLGCTMPPVYRNGAAYDLTTGTWTTIARAPREVVGGWQRAVSGDRLYVMGGFPGRVHEYDASEDAWTVYPEPPHVYGGADTWAATRRFVYVTRIDAPAGVGIDRLDLLARTWTTLPPSPHRPRYGLSQLFPTRHGLVVAGALTDGRSSVLPRVEVLRAGRWQLFDDPPAEARGWMWIREGSRIVAAEGWRRHPGVALDLRTGKWELLPTRPRAPGWSIGHAMGPGVYSSDGSTFDAGANRWLELESPTGDDEPGMGAWVGDELFVLDHDSHAWWLPDAT